MGKTIINGIEYSGSGASNASQLPYDNTMNTKEKIDENAAAISELNSNLANGNVKFSVVDGELYYSVYTEESEV